MIFKNKKPHIFIYISCVFLTFITIASCQPKDINPILEDTETEKPAVEMEEKVTKDIETEKQEWIKCVFVDIMSL